MSTPYQPPSSGDPSQNQPSSPGGYPSDPYSPGQASGYPQQGYPPGQDYQSAGYPPGGGYPQGGQPQGGYPQGGYPQGGYAPPGYPQAGFGYQGAPVPTEEPQPPSTVNGAFWVWLLSAAAAVVSLIFVLVSPMWDQAVAYGVRTSGVSIDSQSLVNTARVIVIVTFGVIIAVFLLFAFKMRAGRNWARIVLTVCGALTLLSAITPTTSTVTVNGEVFRSNTGPTWVTAALAIIGIVLMFLAPSNKFFTDHKAWQMQQYR